MRYWKLFGYGLFLASAALIVIAVMGAAKADLKDQAGWLQAAGAVLAMAAALWISRDDVMRKRDGELQAGEIALLSLLPHLRPAKLALDKSISYAKSVVDAHESPNGVVAFVQQFREITLTLGTIELPSDEQLLRLAPLEREIALSTARFTATVKNARKLCDATFQRVIGNGCTHELMWAETRSIIERLQLCNIYLEKSITSGTKFLEERSLPEFE